MFDIECRTNGERDCTTLTLWVGSDIPCKLNVQAFHRQEADQHAAQLLRAHINKRMALALEDIRRTAYEQGWKDAKGKKRKVRYFWSDWHGRGA